MSDNNEEDFDDDEYFKCKKCKKTAEKIINERTNKLYTICENCRSKCGNKNNKTIAKLNEELPDRPEIPEWKKLLFGKKPNNNIDNNNVMTNINLEEHDISTDSENDDIKHKTINGEMIAGRVNHIESNVKNITTLSLNDKVKHIIDLLSNNTKISKEDDIMDLLDKILLKVINSNNEQNNNNNDNQLLNEMSITLKSLKDEVNKLNSDIREIRNSIM